MLIFLVAPFSPTTLKSRAVQIAERSTVSYPWLSPAADNTTVREVNGRFIRTEVDTVEKELFYIKRTINEQAQFPTHPIFAPDNWTKYAGPLEFIGMLDLRDAIDRLAGSFKPLDPWTNKEDLEKLMGNTTEYKDRIAIAANEFKDTVAVAQFDRFFFFRRWVSESLFGWPPALDLDEALCGLHETVFRETDTFATPFLKMYQDAANNRNQSINLDGVAHHVFSRRLYRVKGLRNKGSDNGQWSLKHFAQRVLPGAPDAVEGEEEQWSMRDFARHNHYTPLLAKEGITLSRTNLSKEIDTFETHNKRRQKKYRIVLTSLAKILDRLRISRFWSAWRLRGLDCAFYQHNQEKVDRHIAVMEAIHPQIVKEVLGQNISAREEPSKVMAAVGLLG